MFEGKDVLVLLANAGTGKGNWVECRIPTPKGITRFGDLKEGDFVFDCCGKPTKVLKVYKRGFLEAYKVTLSDGRSTIVSGDHLWTVYRTPYSNRKYTLELSEIIKEGVRAEDKRENRKFGRAKFYIPCQGIQEYPEKPLSVNPYVFGAFTGNGCLTETGLTFSSNDYETVHKLEFLLGEHVTAVRRSIKNYSWDFFDHVTRMKTSDFFEPLYSHEKYIPACYKYNSVENRFALLQGLFDTDGSVTVAGKRLRVTYSTVSKRLAEDIKEVLSSVGIVSTIVEDKRTGKRTCYNLNVNTTKENKCKLFSLTRKKELCLQSVENKRIYNRVAIRSIEKLPKKLEINCIYVDNEEHLYQCDDGIVTHNTRRLIEEVSKELETRRPEELAFVTFTRKGAEEGLRRVCSKLMYEPEDLPYFRTLHSLTFHAMNLKANQMFGRLDQRKFNKEYGYNVNRCEVDTGKVLATKDSQYLDFYDMERSGALTSKQLVEADIEQGYYRQIVKNYEEYKAREQKVDFFDCLIKYVQEGDSLPVKVAMIDECQDITALQWRVIEKAFARAERIIIAGDDKQCQPTGSKVLTKNGYKNIEELTNKDCLITFAQEDYAYYGKKQREYHPEIAHRFYKGLLYDITVNGVTNRFTPNHRMLVRWLNRNTSLQCVYLMKKGDMFRVGQCQIFSSNGSTHFTTRMNMEGAEEGWILRVCSTKEEALVYEQYYSFAYGIPQLSWSKWYTKEMQKKVYIMLGSLEEKAKALLQSAHRDINYPMFNHEKAQAKSGGTCISLCEACNLIPEIMCVPVYQGKSKTDKDTLWHNFSISYENYNGLVYSLNVPKYHTYVTEGGLTVHNCIFSYSGARPDFLIQLSKQFPVEHLSKSYRIPYSIYKLSVAITNFIGEKTEQKAEPREENGEGMIMQLNNLDRIVNFIDEDCIKNDPEHTAWYILARNNCFLEEPKKVLEDNLIPYWTAEGFFMGGEIMKRLKDYEGFSLEGYRDPKKKEDFQRKFGIEDFSKPFTETNLFTEGRKWVYASYIEKYGLKKLEEMCKWNPQVLVSTIHHVKGGEAKNVAIMLDTTRKTKGNIFNSIDDELRILYVGVTRAKENLFLIDSKNGEGYDEILNVIKNENKLEW